jgi:eukaryotic-like serine/threonine-protein kinase
MQRIREPDAGAEGEEILPGRFAVRTLGIQRLFEVVLAWDEDLFSLVAVKMLRRDRPSDDKGRRALASEAAALEFLSHPVLPRCFEASTGGEPAYLVLEFLEGPRLSTLLRRQGVLAVEQVVPLGLQIASALHYMAGKRMVHLDVKPKNVIMGGPPRLIDLSIARTFERAASTRGPIGTDRYMAPEQRGGVAGSIGPASDVWGLGVTLYEALSGHLPFEEGATDRLFEPATLTRDTPPVLREIVCSAIERRPEDRPSATEIAHALQPLDDMIPRRPLLSRFRVTSWRRGR